MVSCKIRNRIRINTIANPDPEQGLRQMMINKLQTTRTLADSKHWTRLTTSHAQRFQNTVYTYETKTKQDLKRKPWPGYCR